MKDIVLKKTTKKEKEKEKLFTKKKSKVTIEKNYNPFGVNYKIYKRGSELYKMKKEVLEKKEELNLKEFPIKRIKKNANLFSQEELILIKNNIALIEKIYILGILDNI